MRLNTGWLKYVNKKQPKPLLIQGRKPVALGLLFRQRDKSIIFHIHFN